MISQLNPASNQQDAANLRWPFKVVEVEGGSCVLSAHESHSSRKLALLMIFNAMIVFQKQGSERFSNTAARFSNTAANS